MKRARSLTSALSIGTLGRALAAAQGQNCGQALKYQGPFCGSPVAGDLLWAREKRSSTTAKQDTHVLRNKHYTTIVPRFVGSKVMQDTYHQQEYKPQASETGKALELIETWASLGSRACDCWTSTSSFLARSEGMDPYRSPYISLQWSPQTHSFIPY